MNKNQQSANDQKIQQITDKLHDLVAQVKKVNQDIDSTNEAATQGMAEISSEVDGSIDRTKKIFADLDKIDEDAGDELDALSIQMAEDLASEK